MPRLSLSNLLNLVGMVLTVDYLKDALRRHYRNVLRYAFVGASTFALDLGLLVALHELGHLSVVVAATISYWTSIAYNFMMNRQWTFETTASIRRHAVAYGLLLLTNYAVTIGLIALLGTVHINYAVTKIIAVVISASWTYLAYKKLIFV